MAAPLQQVRALLPIAHAITKAEFSENPQVFAFL
jgi:hypothetical protein